MTPSVGDFLALARSSPWRWTSLHLVHRSGSLHGSYGEHVEAWLVRPDGIRLVAADGRRVPLNLDTQRPDGRPTGSWQPPEPAYRPDGLVASRPPDVEDDGLFWENYS